MEFYALKVKMIDDFSKFSAPVIEFKKHYKSKAGKLVEINLTFSRQTPKSKSEKQRLANAKTYQLVDVKISGDFFIYPEEAIFELEKLILSYPVKKAFEKWRNNLIPEGVGIDFEELEKKISETLGIADLS